MLDNIASINLRCIAVDYEPRSSAGNGRHASNSVRVVCGEFACCPTAVFILLCAGVPGRVCCYSSTPLHHPRRPKAYSPRSQMVKLLRYSLGKCPLRKSRPVPKSRYDLLHLQTASWDCLQAVYRAFDLASSAWAGAHGLMRLPPCCVYRAVERTLL